ncbi:MAG: hypothetical protein PHW63_03310 [Alphaproteobacteria bacterium]|nr:hypothetical protein [Alphaproteobacteria bacterium]
MSHGTTSTKVQMVCGKLLGAVLLGFLLLPVGGASLAYAAVDIMGLGPCPDQKVAQAVRDAPRSAYLTELDAATNVFNDTTEANQTNPNPPTELHKLTPYCISSISAGFSIADALMDGAAWISNYINNVITTLLNAPCTYIVGAISAALTTALNAVCIPISLPSFSLSLPSSNGGKTCDGLSLANLVNVNITTAPPLASPLPNNFLSAPMARFIDYLGLNKTQYIGVNNPIKF